MTLVSELNKKNQEYIKRNNLKYVTCKEKVYRCPDSECMLFVSDIGDSLYQCKRCGIIINPSVTYEKIKKLVKK